METELDQATSEKEKLTNGVTFGEQIIASAEKYERLKGNADWQGVIQDVKNLIKIHENEIRAAVTNIPSTNVGEVRNGWFDFIYAHQIRLDQLNEALREPERIMEAAKLARENMAQMKDRINKLEEMTHAH